jgi:Na+/melibiose symporter-like transporter
MVHAADVIRFLISTAIHLAANAIGLLIAVWVLEDMTAEPGPFLLAVGIFTAVAVIAGPLVVNIARKNAPALLGAIALVTTYVGLLVTDAVTDGFDIEGVTTWIAATVIVWLGALLAGFLLPIILVKMGIEHRKDAKAQAAGKTYSP